MSESAVSFEHVSKRFSRGNRVRTLADALLGWPRRMLRKRTADGLAEHEFWALKDVSLQVQRGEMLGIIGPNGSGKSTILKLLFRILRPDRGEVKIGGRVGGLIELGAGFHPYLSGRENVFINGAILGMSRRDIRAQFDKIVDFAGIDEFMDMPVKNYSSGMYARLAFAIAAHANPEVLLVDEVLAVGDASFQMKCYDWMAGVRKRGTTVICVSHNLYQISDQCTRVLFLEQGVVAGTGAPQTMVELYRSRMQNQSQKSEEECARYPDGRARATITTLEFFDAAQTPRQTVQCGEALRIRMGYLVADEMVQPEFAVSLMHSDTRYPLTSYEYLFHVHSPLGEFSKLRGAGLVEVEVPSLQLPVGRYTASVYLFDGLSKALVYKRSGERAIEVERPTWSDGRALMDHRQQWRALGQI